jgi:hypothetical protein
MMTEEQALNWARAFDSNPTGFVELLTAHSAWLNSADRRWNSPLIQKLERVRAAQRKEFAQSRGWSIYRRSFNIEQLRIGRITSPWQCGHDYPVIDHEEQFVLNRRPVAILSHTYGTWEQCVEFAQKHGVAVERLPYSWYFPFNAIAALFTRGAE